MTTDLTGTVALVTGGNSGIGRATAARLGAHVILTGRDTARGEQAVAGIRAGGGKANFIAVSLSGEASARDPARKAAELGGGHVDILVNSAGIFPFGPTDSHTEAEFDDVYDVNVKVPFFLVADLAAAMAARGKGSIINVTTIVAQFGEAGMASTAGARPLSSCSPRPGLPNTAHPASASTRSAPALPVLRAPPLWAMPSTSSPPPPRTAAPACRRHRGRHHLPGRR